MEEQVITYGEAVYLEVNTADGIIFFKEQDAFKNGIYWETNYSKSDERNGVETSNSFVSYANRESMMRAYRRALRINNITTTIMEEELLEIEKHFLSMPNVKEALNLTEISRANRNISNAQKKEV